MKHITPTQNPGKPGYLAQFAHPLLKDKKGKPRVVRRGLGTKDKLTAEDICRRLEILCDNPPPDEVEASQQGHRADVLELFYQGMPKPDWLKSLLHSRGAPVVTLRTQLLTGLELEDGSNVDIVRQIMKKTDAGAIVTRDQLIEIIAATAEAQRIAELEQKTKKQERELNVVRPRIEQLEEDNHRMRQRLNLHVTVRIGKAAATFLDEYKASLNTRQRVERAVNLFVGSLKNKDQQLLATVSGADVDSWLAKLRAEGGIELSVNTRRNQRAYVSSFLSWAARRYGLTVNPILSSERVKGRRGPVKIEAIRDYRHLQDYIDVFGRHPYWQAWVATACLTGLRYSEQAGLKLSDIDLKSSIQVVARKTPVPRFVPIEQSTLLPILKRHLAARKTGTHGDSPFVFPSIVPDNPYSPRRKTEPGIWADGRVWHYAFDDMRSKLKSKKALTQYMSFGPKQWRHTFGTALAHCGWGSREISARMGNSEKIVNAFYIAGAGSAGPDSRWPLEFTKPN